MASPGDVEEDNVLAALNNAYPLPVAYARKALVEFRSRDSPLPRLTFSFKPGDYLHFKQPLEGTGWWVGRVVGERMWLGLLPGEDKLRTYRDHLTSPAHRDRLASGQDRAAYTGPVYDDAPIMRPVVLVGPSKKEAELSELLQKALVSYMRDQFTGRLHTVKPLHSVGRSTADNKGVSVRGEVYRAGCTLNLVYLDCDATYPDDLDWLRLHPLLVYVQVARRRVLQRLVQELTTRSEEREAQLQTAYRLYELCTLSPSPYSLVITDSDLDDACETLELFLESYWAATRSVRLSALNPQHSPSLAASPS